MKVVLIYLKDDATGEIRAETEKEGGGGRKKERERKVDPSVGNMVMNSG